jgi:hypothetical protein
MIRWEQAPVTINDPDTLPPPRWRGGNPLFRFWPGLDCGPDRRGEAFEIFTTIFVRPVLDLHEAMARIARSSVERAAPPCRAAVRAVENRT